MEMEEKVIQQCPRCLFLAGEGEYNHAFRLCKYCVDTEMEIQNIPWKERTEHLKALFA